MLQDKQSFLSFDDAIRRLGKDVVADRYGNLFQMYKKNQGRRPLQNPDDDLSAIHYTMGGIWVDYELSTIPGLFAIGEANYLSDHGANRLGGGSNARDGG